MTKGNLKARKPPTIKVIKHPHPGWTLHKINKAIIPITVYNKVKTPSKI